MDCPICAEHFNRSNRKAIACLSCHFQVCHDCLGTYLKTKEEADCMNCHHQWDYEFLCQKMTKTFMKTQYKEHLQTILMRELEGELGSYQDVAVLMNKKENVLKKLMTIKRQMREWERERDAYVHFHVVFQDQRYQLSLKMAEDLDVSRKGTLILQYIEKIVNPPPSEQDHVLIQNEKNRLEKERLRLKILHTFAVLNFNIEYTDKFLIALSAEISGIESTPEEKTSQLAMMEQLKTECQAIQDQWGVLYQTSLEEGTDDKVRVMAEQYRKVCRQFWKCHFKIRLPTKDDFKQIDQNKITYLAHVNECKQQLIKNIWEREDVEFKFNSNRRYFYNLDDETLVGYGNDPRVMEVLQKEHSQCLENVQKCDNGLRQIIPFYAELATEYAKIDKELRLKKRQKIGHHDMMACPSGICLGKLKDNGDCGLCGKHYCLECMQETLSIEHTCKKEDKETIRELYKTTRPCPKCHVRISKIEGCDQMWCVQCHTTFSWKTGAISHGVVHNPHYYEHRRQTDGEMHRAPGDIPCGGLPNEIEMMRGNSRLLTDIWQYLIWLTENHMPSIYRRFYNVRPVKYRRYSLAYLRGKMDRKRLGTLLHMNFLDEIRYSHYYSILETLVDNMAEYMRQYVNGTNTEKECLELLRIARGDIERISQLYHIRFRFGGARFL